MKVAGVCGGRVPERRKLHRVYTCVSRPSSPGLQQSSHQLTYVKELPEAREREGIFFEAHTRPAIVQQRANELPSR